MTTRGKFLRAVASLLSVRVIFAQQLPTAELQKLLNPPQCPVCHNPVDVPPINLMVESDDRVFDGSILGFPTLVCLKCGVHFSVQP